MDVARLELMSDPKSPSQLVMVREFGTERVYYMKKNAIVCVNGEWLKISRRDLLRQRAERERD